MFFISSPITIRELRPLLRSRKAFWFALLALLLAGGVIGIYFPETNFSNFSERAMFGRSCFMGLSLFMLCALGLISPIITSTAITAEREAGTLELLVSTGLARRRILLGKLAASLTYQLLFVIMMLPILAMPFQIGGVGMDEIFFSALMISVTAVVYGMVGLAVSAMMRKSAAALVVTVILIIMPTLFCIYWDDFFGDSVLAECSRFSSPPISFIYLTNKIERQTVSPFSQAASNIFSGDFHAYLALQVPFCFFFWMMAVWGMGRRKAERVAVARKVIRDPALLERRRKRWPYYLIDPLRSEQVIADGHNPVYVKERRVGILSHPASLVRCCYVGATISIILGVMMIFEGDVISMPMLALSLITPLGLVCLTQGALAIARERAAKTLELLTVTILAPRQIIRAKFLAVMRFTFILCASVLTIPALLTPGFYLMIRLTVLITGKGKLDGAIFLEYFMTMAEAMLFTLSYCSFYAALGIYCSTRFQRPLAAIVASFMLVGALALLPLFLMGAGMMDVMETTRSIWEQTCYLLGCAMNPFALFLACIEHDSPFGPFVLNWRILGQIAVLLAMVFALAWLFLRLAAARLARLEKLS